jgi:hypothetical protein
MGKARKQKKNINNNNFCKESITYFSLIRHSIKNEKTAGDTQTATSSHKPPNKNLGG